MCGVVLILMCAAIGGAMALWPQTLWWIFESWKFRNPEANEPSDAVYAITRVSGVLVAITGLFVGIAIIGDERDAQREEQAEQAAAQAEADFVPPPPEKRGLLPMIGYYVNPAATTRAQMEAYFIVPEDSWSADVKRMTDDSQRFTTPCYYEPKVMDLPDGRVVVSAELIWAPQRLSDMDESGGCYLGPKHKIDGITLSRPTEPVVVTNEKIVDQDGAEIAPAAAGNILPRLSRAIEGGYSGTTTASARGVIPVVGYRFGAGGTLEIDYLQADGATFTRREETMYRGGCEILPTVTGLGTDTVTVGLWLRWTDDGRDRPEADAACRVTDEWRRVATDKVATGIPDSSTVLTNGPIADRTGAVVQPAAPGNQVPPAQ